MNKLYIVVPAYNEEEILKSSAEVLLNILKKLISDNLVCDESRILFVNDGSIDSTWQIIKDLKKLDEHFTGISFSRNEGHQKAVLAGLKNSVEKGADLTVAVLNVSLKEASRFGIMNTNKDGSIYEFEEKPAKPKSTLASMGIYIFTYKELRKYFTEEEIIIMSEAVADHLRPVREEYARLMADKAYLESCYRKGAELSERISRRTLEKVMKKVGFIL